uniref:Galectin n=1 Tax=Pundamilia nyererei TaxID=303518 RepID=A0A3B4H981_9CICH
MVFPFPGGPNKSKPRAGALRPVKRSDVAFHIHPRFREGIVVRNSMIGGNWGQEEREMSMNPFMEGQYFDEITEIQQKTPNKKDTHIINTHRYKNISASCRNTKISILKKV